MNKKLILPILALLIYAIIIWPKGDLPENVSKSNEASDTATASKKETTPRTPQRGVDPNFKPEVVKAQETNEEKPFRVTSPEALAFAEHERLALEVGPGKTPAITKKQIEESPQLQSAIKGIENPEEFGSRLSPLIKAAKFDKQRFQNDKVYREEYLPTAEPDRVHQLDDNSNYKLKRKSPYYQEVLQGKSVFISVEAEPNMPVSITSFDLGKFGNHLTYQTILSDSSGLATFEFFGMPGTFNDTNILVSSPTSKGQARFAVKTIINTEKSN